MRNNLIIFLHAGFLAESKANAEIPIVEMTRIATPESDKKTSENDQIIWSGTLKALSTN
jgi:hypothetical protein